MSDFPSVSQRISDMFFSNASIWPLTPTIKRQEVISSSSSPISIPPASVSVPCLPWCQHTCAVSQQSNKWTPSLLQKNPAAPQPSGAETGPSWSRTQSQLGVIDSNLKKVKYLASRADSIQDDLPLKKRKQSWSACDLPGAGPVKEIGDYLYSYYRIFSTNQIAQNTQRNRNLSYTWHKEVNIFSLSEKHRSWINIGSVTN